MADKRDTFSSKSDEEEPELKRSLVLRQDGREARPIGKEIFFSAERTLQGKRPRCALASPWYGFLNVLVEGINQLLRGAYASPGLAFFKQQYVAILDHHDFVTVRGHIRLVELVQAFIAHYPPSLLALLHCDLDQMRPPTANWLARLPFAQKVQHPLHHLLLIHFLGSSPEQFLRVPISPPLPFGESPWPCLNPVCERYQTLCIQNYTRRVNTKGYIPIGVFACPFFR